MNPSELESTHDARRQERRALLAGFGAAALGLALFQHDSLRRAAPAPARRRPGALPNPLVVDQHGEKLRFYDDLIRGKVVAISMTYAQCAASCPATMANLIQVQRMLGARAGRDVFMYSITLFPEVDSPKVLKAYAEGFGVGPGWRFLTGHPADIESLRFALGFYDMDPVVDADRAQHANMVRIGNDAFERWIMAPGLSRPEQIVATINHIDPKRVHTAHS